jgi:pimeloyl-ACP methyl ester carboxylesterase
MGAATAVYTAQLDARIQALVLEACYRDLPTAVSDYARLIIPFLPGAVIRRALCIASHKGDFHPEVLSPLAAMPDLKMPVLFVQGTADRRIKPRYVREHFRAKPEPKELHYIEGAGHGRVWHEGGDAYMQKLTDWLTQHMPVLE